MPKTDFTNLQALLLFLGFFVPGFISISVFDLLIPGEKRDFVKSLPQIVAFSALNYILPLALYIAFADWLIEHILYVAPFVLFIMPASWPAILLKILKWPFFAKRVINPIPSPWDFVFGQGETYWVIVHMQDGKKIGGIYGSRSYSSSYPNEAQVYLEAAWRIDEEGKFHEIKNTRGIIIFTKNVLAVEFFESPGRDVTTGRMEETSNG
ncbi:MAG: hypothetical protein HQL51_09670 [Magnetococcales bacterium]|nr:hypothetical protein [Magnetococcales bacterium]